ncbi:MAG: hypothetical protein NTW26_03355 [bacterium]|nr:hypothetical protein [bacterium]
MPKTAVLSTIALLIAAALLAGCGGEEAPVPDETGTPPSNDGPSPLPGPLGDATDFPPCVTYSSLSTPPGGAPFSTEVTITRCGENPAAFELVWTGGGHDARGVGMTFGQGLFAVARVGPGGLDIGVYRLEAALFPPSASRAPARLWRRSSARSPANRRPWARGPRTRRSR